MKSWIIIACSALIVGCASAPRKPPPDTRAASIEYALPQTKVALGLTLTLVDCGQNDLTLEPVVSIAAVAVPGPERFRLSGSDLSSARQKRELAVQLYENGTLKSINTLGSDRSFAVIGNVFKFLVSAVKTVASAAVTSEMCNEATLAALARAGALQKRLDALAALPPTPASPEQLIARAGAMNALRTELAALRTGPLRIELRQTVDVPSRLVAKTRSIPAKPITWDAQALRVWTAEDGQARPAEEPRAREERLTGIMKRLELEMRFEAPKADTPEGKALDTADETVPSCSGKSCPALVLREPVTGTVILHAKDLNQWHGHRGGIGTALAKLSMPMAHWGPTSYLPIGVRLGESRSVKLELDPYGRKTSFSWSADARAEAITAGFAQTAEALGVLRSTVDPADPTPLQLRQATIAELEALQKYNKLLACEAILRAGGYVCPP